MCNCCNDERLFTKAEVSAIVRRRVNKLNARIDELELELVIQNLKNNKEQMSDE